MMQTDLDIIKKYFHLCNRAKDNGLTLTISGDFLELSGSYKHDEPIVLSATLEDIERFLDKYYLKRSDQILEDINKAIQECKEALKNG